LKILGKLAGRGGSLGSGIVSAVGVKSVDWLNCVKLRLDLLPNIFMSQVQSLAKLLLGNSF
jgi:hypothetical protein